MCENTTKKGTDDGSHTVCCAEDTGESGSLSRRGAQGYDGVCSTRDARSAGTSNCPSHDESGAIFGHGTDQASDLEDENGQEEGRLHAEVFVRFAPGALEGSHGQKKGAAVPPHIVEGVELVGDSWNRGGYDCLWFNTWSASGIHMTGRSADTHHIESDEKDGEDQSDDDTNKANALGIFHAIVGIGGC